MSNLFNPDPNFGLNRAAVVAFLAEIDNLTAEQITAIGQAWERWRGLDETYLLGQEVFSQNLRAAAQVAARHEAWEHVDRRCQEIKYCGSSTGAEQGAREVAAALVYQDLLAPATYDLIVSFWRDGVGYEPIRTVTGWLAKKSGV